MLANARETAALTHTGGVYSVVPPTVISEGTEEFFYRCDYTS